MTKRVRVENADSSNYKVKVHVEQLQTDGTWLRTDTKELMFPAELTELYVHGHQRLIVEEG